MESTNSKMVLYLDGENIKDNLINARSFGESILSLNDSIIRADELLNSKVTCVVKVDAKFKPGSFEIQLIIQQIINDFAIPLLTSNGLTALVNFAAIYQIIFGSSPKSIISVLRMISDTKIIETKIESNKAIVITADGKSIEIFKDGIILLEDKYFRQKLSDAAYNMLSGNSAEVARISAPELNDAIELERPDIQNLEYQGYEDDEILHKETIDADLEIISMSFEEDRKWEFRSYGDIFRAEMECGTEFFDKIGKEEFSKGDKLKVKLQTIIYKPNTRIRTKRTIFQVYEHIRNPRQTELNY